MAKVLLLGTWVKDVREAREEIERRHGGSLQFGGLGNQIEITGPRIEIERRLVADDRTWTHGMPRSVMDGRVEQQSDELFVVVDENGRKE